MINTPALICLGCLFLAINVADAAIGIDWGRQNYQRLLPSNVVDLLLQNGIRQARVFTTEMDLLEAFAESGIDLTITIFNTSTIDTPAKARFWVRSRESYFKTSNVRRIYMADYAFAAGVNEPAVLNSAMAAYLSLQGAINDEGFGEQIKVTIPHQTFTLTVNKATLRPSEAEFREEIKPQMATFLRVLQENNAPFVIAILPISHIRDFGIDMNFAMFDNKSSFVVKDVNGAVYTNLFELVYDSYIWALRKLNASDIKVIIGQVGWPTDGSPGANATMAERFYKGFLPWVASNNGTPMRPGVPIDDIFIHSLTDEHKMPYLSNMTFIRHFGIYRSNGKPKYKIDLSGQGRDIYPTDATGIMRMPERWCVYNGNRSDMAKVAAQVTKACTKADCTTLAQGASCSQLDFTQNVSYAFNMHFQFQYQSEKDCDFDGLGYVTDVDPSTPECIFPVEVVKAQLPPYVMPNGQGKGCPERLNRAIFAIFLSILGTFFWNV